MLGNFTNDNETKMLMRMFIKLLGSESAVLRRTAATNLVVLAVTCRKPQVFASWLLNTATSMLLPLGDTFYFIPTLKLGAAALFQ